MTFPSSGTLLDFYALPTWAMAVSLALHLAAGTGIGILYFHGVWRTTQRLASGNGIIRTIGLTLGRFAALGGVLFVVSLEGAPPLLVTALGVLIARAIVIRQTKEATS